MLDEVLNRVRFLGGESELGDFDNLRLFLVYLCDAGLLHGLILLNLGL